MAANVKRLDEQFAKLTRNALLVDWQARGSASGWECYVGLGENDRAGGVPTRMKFSAVIGENSPSIQ